jgi:hypothetical protein
VTHEEQAAIILGRAAQYEPAHVLEFKEQMLEREGRTATTSRTASRSGKTHHHARKPSVHAGLRRDLPLS